MYMASWPTLQCIECRAQLISQRVPSASDHPPQRALRASGSITSDTIIRVIVRRAIVLVLRLCHLA